MEELLQHMIGEQIDVVCSGAPMVRGECTRFDPGIMQVIDDQGNMCYIAIDKIVAVWLRKEKDRHPGFVLKTGQQRPVL